jgi:integrase/recombinase XerD
MLLSNIAPDYISYIRHELGYSPRTVTTYQSRLNHNAKWLHENGYPDADITVFAAPVLRRYLYAESARGLRPRTLRGLFHPLVGLGDFLVAQSLIPDNPARTIKMPKMDAANRVLASDRDLTALMTGVELQSDPRNVAFERALFSVLINCGPRAAELLGMKLDHFSTETKTLLIAHGKGEKSRTLHPPSDTDAAVQEWILERQKMDCSHDWLWSITKTRRLGYDGLRALLEEAKARAGLAGNNNIHCHAIRRAFATRMMTRGGSIKAIQAALGHTQTETTFRYLFLAEEGAKVMADIGALAQEAPKPPAPPETSQANQVVKMVSKATFHASRRRTPAK